jgi:hypothetical protein
MNHFVAKDTHPLSHDESMTSFRIAFKTEKAHSLFFRQRHELFNSSGAF